MLSLAINSLFSPAQGIRKVLLLPYARSVFLLGAGIIACLSGIVNGILPPNAEAMVASPFLVALMECAVFAITALGVGYIGRFFGGTGTMDGAIKVVVWHGALEVLCFAVIVLLVALVGQTAEALLIGVMFWLFYVLVVFVKELHGFQSVFLTALGMIGVVAAFSICAGLILVSTGLVSLEVPT